MEKVLEYVAGTALVFTVLLFFYALIKEFYQELVYFVNRYLRKK